MHEKTLVSVDIGNGRGDHSGIDEGRIKNTKTIRRVIFRALVCSQWSLELSESSCRNRVVFDCYFYRFTGAVVDDGDGISWFGTMGDTDQQECKKMVEKGR